ncbi:MAG: hypothetical protein ABMB14_32615 [Myxococcota bacterium]
MYDFLFRLDQQVARDYLGSIAGRTISDEAGDVVASALGVTPTAGKSAFHVVGGVALAASVGYVAHRVLTR